VSENPNTLEQMLLNSMSLMVQRVARDPSSTPAVVLAHLAATLGRFLAPNSATEARLVVMWRSRGSAIGVEWQSPRADPRSLAPERLRALAAGFAEAYTDHETWKPISIWWWGDDRHALRISLSATLPDSEALEILYTGVVSHNERWSWFVKYIRGLTELYHNVRGLLVIRLGMLREQYNAKVQALRSTRAASLHETLTGALALVQPLLEIGATDLLEEVFTSLILHVFGTRWQVRAARQRLPAAADHELPGTLLKQLADQVRNHAGRTGSTDGSRLLGLIDCLDAVVSPRTSPGREPAAATGDEMLFLLAMWTRIHELSRGRKRLADPDPDAEAAWASATARTIPLLVGRLTRSLEGGAPVEQSRNWLIMWFCLEVLSKEFEKETRDTYAWHGVRAELAYTLREVLRQDLFGSRVDYFYDASTLASAVAHLVAYHATYVVGIPSAYQIEAAMELIGGEGGGNRHAAVEHLQHVADIYIAGHFLLSLQLERAGAVATAAELFADNAPPDEVEKYRRAFSMAAIFHDVGYVFLSSDAALSEKGLLDDDNVRSVRESRGHASRAHAIALTKNCIEQLELDARGRPPEHGARRFMYFDDADRKERKVEQCIEHFERQAQAGHANHGLVAAWYLHRICVRAEGLEYEDPAMHRCRMMAVRAILLHDVVTVKIDADRDPIAALLVTCNEVFDWSPARHAAGSSRAPGQLPRGTGANVPTYRVDRSVVVRHIARAQAKGPTATRFDVVLRSPDGNWPVVVVELMPPEYLDGPVLCIWLAKAQAMGRIKPARRSGFAPSLWIRSALDPDLVHCGLDTCSALREALSEDRSLPEVVEWCKGRERFRSRTGPQSGVEQVRLGHLERKIYDGDIQDRIPEIVQKVVDYLDRLEREQHR
jgi:hypothetical protein